MPANASSGSNGCRTLEQNLMSAVRGLPKGRRRPPITGHHEHSAPAAIAVVLAMATLAVATSAHAAPGMEVGLQDDAVFLYQNYYNRDLALEQARQLGVTRLRVNVLWNRIAAAQAGQRHPPAQVTYNWAPYDSLVDAAAAYGIKVQFSLAGPAPAWANAQAPQRRSFRRLQAERAPTSATSRTPSPSTSRAGWTATRSGTSRTGRGWLAP